VALELKRLGKTMSVYAIDKLCRDALHDLAFRDALKRDPAAAIAPPTANACAII